MADNSSFGSRDGLKTLHLIDSGGLYGAERMLLSLALEQQRQGEQPLVLSAGDPGVGDKAVEIRARELGVPVTTWRMRPGFNLRQARRIVGWARDQGIQLMHSHGYKFNILMGFCSARMRAGLPLACTLHGYIKAPRWTKLAVYETLDRLVLHRADGVAIVDEGMRRLLPQRVAASSRCVFIPNGLSEHPPQTRILPDPIARFVAGKKTNFLAVGRLSREKGFDVLIQALEDHRGVLADIGVVLLGDGPLRESLQERIDQAGLTDHVLLAGYAEAAPLMPHFDAIAIPSRTEGLPMTALEALRARLPIIATLVGGLPTLLNGLPSAKLIEPADSDQLARALLQAHRGCFAARDTDAGERRFRQYYGVTAMARCYNRLYRQLLPRADT